MSFHDYDAGYVPAAPVCHVFLGAGGKESTLGPLEAIIDTGADISVVPTNYLRQIRAQKISQGQAKSLWGDSRTVDVYAISMKLNGLHITAIRVLADEQGDEVVLGRSVLNRLKLVLDGPASITEIVDYI